MPGNPLPKIEINASRWPYDESGPANGKFGQVAVTPAAKAVFDANEMTVEMAPSNGYVANLDQNRKVSTVIPNEDGRRGFLVSYPRLPNAYADNHTPKINLKFAEPQSHFYEVIKVYQPTNYKIVKRVEVELSESDYAIAQGWDEGDALESGNLTAFVRQVGDTIPSVPSPYDYQMIITLETGEHANWKNRSVTNTTKNETVQILGGRGLGENNKFSIWWCDDEFTGGSQSGYSNAAFNFEVTAGGSYPASGVLKYNSSSTKQQLNVGEPNNLVEDEPDKPVILDTADNGSTVTLVLERQRAPEDSKWSGIARVWKQTDNMPLKLIFDARVYGWTEPEENKFTHGYLFGWANSGYDEQTDFYLERLEYWWQKPEILTSAGL